MQLRWAYEAAGVLEYLIVDPEEQVGELLRLDTEGHYQTAARVGGSRSRSGATGSTHCVRYLEWGAVVALLGGKLSLTLG